MLLIHCPYCERTARSSSSATPARRISRARRTIAAITDEDLRRRSSSSATNPKGLHFERWRHIHGCGRFFNAVRDTVTDRFLATYKAGEPKPDARRRCAPRMRQGRRRNEPAAIPHRRRRPPDARQARSASPSTAAAYTGARGRHARLGAARQRRPSGRPLVQVSPPARHPVGRRRRSRTRWSTCRATPAAHDAEPARHRAGSSTTACRAESQNRWPSLAFDVGAVNDLPAPFFSAGFYYKTFMWPQAAWKHALRADHPRGRRPRRRADASPTPTTIASRYAHCDVLVVGAGPAGLAAALAAAETGARVILVRRAGRARRRAALRDRRRPSTARPAGTGRRRRVADARRAWPNVTAAAAHARPSATTPRTSSAWPSASPTISPAPTSDLPRERLWQVRAKRGRARHRRASSGRWCSPTTTGPASCWRRRRATYLNRYGVAVGSSVGVFTANDRAYAAAFDLTKAGVADRRDRRPAATSRPGRWSTQARALGIEIADRPRRHRHARAGCASSLDRPCSRTAAAPQRDDRLSTRC